MRNVVCKRLRAEARVICNNNAIEGLRAVNVKRGDGRGSFVVARHAPDSYRAVYKVLKRNYMVA
jgi:hypothetical protein